MFPPRIELGTLRVLGARDNHYTTETCVFAAGRILTGFHQFFQGEFFLLNGYEDYIKTFSRSKFAYYYTRCKVKLN